MSEFFIGLMSGTSADGIDAVLVDFGNDSVQLRGHLFTPFCLDVKQRIESLFLPGSDALDTVADLDNLLGELFAEAANNLLHVSGYQASDVAAIGSHGQTIRHRPSSVRPFSCQIGDPNVIVERTGITTVADFRRRDMATGGNGAPLVPAFHQAVFANSRQTQSVINIGGISNITFLPVSGYVTGFDCGPGNGLIDAWMQKAVGKSYDEGGSFARSGAIDHKLLEALKQAPFFAAPPPKSTGKEVFNLNWFYEIAGGTPRQAVDVAATLTELTAWAIADAIHRHCEGTKEAYICGGGAFNMYLMERLEHHIALPLLTTEALGINPQHVEAMAFAWMARQTLKGVPSSIASVTGARAPRILGAIYQK